MFKTHGLEMPSLKKNVSFPREVLVNSGAVCAAAAMKILRMHF